MVRADQLLEPDLPRLRARFGGALLYSLRSRAAGGAAALSAAERRRRLCNAAADYDLVELEGEGDLQPEILAAVPAAQRVITWYGAAASTTALAERFQALAATPARWYCLVPSVHTVGQTLAALRLLPHLGRHDVIVYGAGEAGTWSRPLGGCCGAPVVFGALEAESTEPGEPTVSQLVSDYGLGAGFQPTTPPVRLFGIVGARVAGSLAPRLLNQAFRQAGLAALYLPWSMPRLEDFWKELVQGEALAPLGLGLGGLTVVAPHKEAALAMATSHSALSHSAGAANLLTPVGGDGWHADSTDAQGVLEPLADLGVNLRGQAAVVIGCGGAGRAVVCGLRAAGARVVLANRSPARGRQAAATLGVPFVPLTALRGEDFAVVVNATPISAEPRLESHQLAPSTVLVDMPYTTTPTPTVAAARAAGCRVIDGRAVLVAEMRHQLRLMTGIEATAQQLASTLDGG